MIRHILLAFSIVLSSTLALNSTASAQTTDAYVNQFLNETERVIEEGDRHLNEVVIPEGQQDRAYLQQLSDNCNAGKMKACNEYNIRMDRQHCHLDMVQECMEQYYPNR
jgi:hypothetical protein